VLSPLRLGCKCLVWFGHKDLKHFESLMHVEYYVAVQITVSLLLKQEACFSSEAGNITSKCNGITVYTLSL
jgi:hypothetical protein